MLKKTITYTDYNGVERTEDFYFNLTKAELLEMQISATGGFDTMVMKIVNAKDNQALIKIFKDIVLKAYGEKSDDGRRFIKNDEVRANFAQTEAYSKLFVELASDAKAAADFVNGITPGDVDKEQVKALVDQHTIS